MTRRTVLARRRASPGQGLVEFALVLPIIVLLFCGIFDLGRAVFAYDTIANAARDGARIAAVNQIVTSPDCREDVPVEDPSDPHWSIQRCAADAAVSLGVQPGDVTIAYAVPAGTTLTCTAARITVGCLAQVTVHYTFVPITPVIGSLVGNIAISGSSQMPVERVFP